MAIAVGMGKRIASAKEQVVDSLTSTVLLRRSTPEIYIYMDNKSNHENRRRYS